MFYLCEMLKNFKKKFERTQKFEIFYMSIKLSTDNYQSMIYHNNYENVNKWQKKN